MEEEEEQDWIFTFGFGQDYPGHFVRIFGTYMEARGEMIVRFGRKWAFQYESEDVAGVRRFDLKELKI